jgi:ATP-binding cassette, subfamily B (MDR/TAP), member 1
MSVMTSLAHINTLSTPLTAVSNAITAGATFFKIIDAPKPSTSGIKEDEVDMDADIVLENVHFTYTIRPDAKILHGLSLRIPLGKTTAIVGPSGSGKSTTVALIQRWFELGGSDPIANYFRNGIVRIGERKLNEIDLYWWRAQIGLVQQEPFLFNDTIYKNVEYGLTGTEWENSSVEIKNALVTKACKEAYVDEFVRSLPDVSSLGIQ